MKKALSILLAAVLILSVFTGHSSYSEQESGGPSYTVSGGECLPGDSVDVFVSIENNPGIISLRFSVFYEGAALELAAVEDLGLLKGFTTPAAEVSSPYILRWADALATENNTAEGQVAKLTFRVKETAAPGDYVVYVNPLEARNAFGGKVAFEGAGADIAVLKAVKGDADGDGEVTDWDSILFERFLAGWQVAVPLGLMDIDKDGEISDWDSILLNRYLAGWEVDEMNDINEPTEMPTAEPTAEPVEDLEVYVYPKPVSMTLSNKASDAADGSLLTPGDRSYDSIFTHFGFDLGEGGLPVEIIINESFENEQYTLVSQKDRVTLTASGSDGIYAAVSTLSQLRVNNKIAAAEISDKPAIPLRGVIEGFYGTAWTNSFRMDLFRFMGKYKLNAYIYAPKDDPKHRSQWRTKYSSFELNNLKRLVDCAKENNVSFVYAISPGGDIDLGSGYEADFAKLTAKCESMYGIGVRDFAILLDDITTLDPQGHAMLVNDFQNNFIKTHEGCSDLIMITTEYCDAYVTEYSSAIGPLIRSDIRIMWTGESLFPTRITNTTLRTATRLYNRKIFIWWNYPVNDLFHDNLFLGPCESLAKNLSSTVNAFVANPMNQGYASMLPIMTISDFLWNPSGYSKEESLTEAVKKLMPECSDGLYTFADLCRAAFVNGNKSSLQFSSEAASYLSGNTAALKTLKPKLEKAKADLADLREKGTSGFLNEADRWLTKAQNLVDMALLYIEYENASDPQSKSAAAAEFLALEDTVSKSTALVSEDVLVPFVNAAKASISGNKGN